MSLFDGSLRFHEGRLERYFGQDQEWMTPRKWQEAKTQDSFLHDFNASTLWGCQFNMYSEHCYTAWTKALTMLSWKTDEEA